MTPTSTNRPPAVRLLSRAKINLCLSIIGKQNHYHLVESINAFVSLADELTITPHHRFELRATGPVAMPLADGLADGLVDCLEGGSAGEGGSNKGGSKREGGSNGEEKSKGKGGSKGEEETKGRWHSEGERFEENLITKAALLVGLKARVNVKKRIWLRAGLGGGSSNCGEVLKLAMDPPHLPASLATNRFSPQQLHRKARQLGSDVAFFLQSKPCLVSSSGQLKAICLPAMWAVLAYVPEGISTATAYKAYGKTHSTKPHNPLRSKPHSTKPRSKPHSLPYSPPYSQPLKRNLPKDFEGWVAYLRQTGNDLTATAYKLLPPMKQVAKQLNLHSPYVAMSGSGSTLFSLHRTKSEATTAQRTIPHSVVVKVYGN